MNRGFHQVQRSLKVKSQDLLGGKVQTMKRRKNEVVGEQGLRNLKLKFDTFKGNSIYYIYKGN